MNYPIENTHIQEMCDYYLNILNDPKSEKAKREEAYAFLKAKLKADIPDIDYISLTVFVPKRVPESNPEGWNKLMDAIFSQGLHFKQSDYQSFRFDDDSIKRFKAQKEAKKND